MLDESIEIAGRVAGEIIKTGKVRFERTVRSLNKAKNLRYVGYGVLALTLILPMTLVSAAGSPTIPTIVAGVNTDTSALQSLTANVVEPVQSTVTIDVTPSSQYLDEQARLQAVAAKQAAAQKAVVLAVVRPTTDVLSAIRYCESHNNYQAQNRRSTASGAYQFLDSTWAHFGGYTRAKDAPADVQDQKANLTIQLRGTAPWNASRSCWARASR